MPVYGDYQLEIYWNGLGGVLPKLPTDYATLVKRAEAALPDMVLNYVQGGCGDELTQDRNVTAFGDWGMVPRMMVDASNPDLSIELFGMKLPHPLFMAPIGVTGMATQDQHGDIAGGSGLGHDQRALLPYHTFERSDGRGNPPLRQRPIVLSALYAQRQRARGKSWCAARRLRVTKPWSLPSTPPFWAGGRETLTPRTSPSCAAMSCKTISLTPVFETCLANPSKKTCKTRSQP